MGVFEGKLSDLTYDRYGELDIDLCSLCLSYVFCWGVVLFSYFLKRNKYVRNKL